MYNQTIDLWSRPTVQAKVGKQQSASSGNNSCFGNNHVSNVSIGKASMEVDFHPNNGI